MSPLLQAGEHAKECLVSLLRPALAAEENQAVSAILKGQAGAEAAEEKASSQKRWPGKRGYS
jgi:hypothetical protein